MGNNISNIRRMAMEYTEGGGNCKLDYDREINRVRLESYYTNLALNRFKWTNLPEGLESRHIEKALFFGGQAIFFNMNLFDKNVDGFTCLPCYCDSSFDIYGDSITVTAKAHTRAYPGISLNDGVLIKSNDLKFPLYEHVKYYSDLLAEVEDLKRNNLELQKMPYMIFTNKEMEFSIKNILEKIRKGAREIFVDKRALNKSDFNIEIFNTNSPYLLDKLSTDEQTLENKLMSILGFNNNSLEKKERLLVDEVNANNPTIDNSLEMEYKHRLLARDYINKKFNLNVDVEKTIENIYIKNEKSKEEEDNKKGWWS